MTDPSIRMARKMADAILAHIREAGRAARAKVAAYRRDHRAMEALRETPRGGEVLQARLVSIPRDGGDGWDWAWIVERGACDQSRTCRPDPAEAILAASGVGNADGHGWREFTVRAVISDAPGARHWERPQATEIEQERDAWRAYALALEAFYWALPKQASDK